MGPHTATTIFLLLSTVSVQGGEYTDRFLALYHTITNSSNRYFSKEGIPYHCVETMMVTSVDYGHETTSEGQSYNVWLKAMYGAISGNFSDFNQAWSVIDNYYVPQTQYNDEKYNASAGGESSGVTKGLDPIGPELKATYGDNKLRAMHWLLDVDNIYGFGNVQGDCEAGPSASGPSLIKNGAGTVWQGITYPTCDNFKYGGSNGFSWDTSVPNYGYSSAPDAEARAIMAGFWASRWASEAGKTSQISSTLSKVAELADYTRYAFFDRRFKRIGNCIGPTACTPGVGKESAHYLISWSINWGGSIDSQGGYAWRMGSSDAHIAYQNPVAAYGVVNDANLKPKSASAHEDWKNSLERQLEFYKYVQTSDGLLGGGVTNSWSGNYSDPPESVKNNSFHGMWYETEPAYAGTSDWFVMQSWTVDRLAQYYYLTDDATAKSIVEKWLNWVIDHTNVTSTAFSVPDTLSWSGTIPADTKAKIVASGSTIGIGSSIARAATYYAAKSGDTDVKYFAQKLLDAIWNNYRDSIGLSTESTVTSLLQVTTKVYIPLSGWTGTYPHGQQINSTSTFLDIRPWIKQDPNWPQLEAYLNGGPAPKISYHRFWEQADVALALGAYGLLFNE